MSDKALATFERRFEDWRVDHPWQWIATTDRTTAAKFISDQTEKIRKTQLEAADRIIVSQERISSGIDEIAAGVDRVADGLEGLASAFEWGFSEMVWQLEQQRTTLEEILKVLRAPLDTQARELRKRAEDAYRNGWIEDAHQDFLESENKNRYDFTIHQSLGNIYFFHKKIPEKALEYYEKAVKYATPKSPYHTSIALLHIGLTKYLQKDFKGAHEATSKAIELSPNLYEAYYQRAQYCANLGKYNEALDHLWKAIRGDRNYCLKAESEKDFDVMRQQLRSFFEDMRNEAQKDAKEETNKAKELIAYAESYGLSASGESQKFKTAVEKYRAANEFLKRASLFDYWDATYMARDVEGLTLDALEGYLAGQISRASEEHTGQISRASEEHTIAMTKFEDREHWCFVAPFVVLAGIHILCYIVCAIGLFLEKNIGGGIAWLVFGAILLVIAFAINGVALWGLTALIIRPIFYFLRKKEKARYESRCKKEKARYESRLAQIHGNLSKVKNKRKELNR